MLAGLREVFPPNWEEKLNKAHRLHAEKQLTAEKYPQTPAPATSKRGRNGEEPAAFLRVRTSQKALRAVGGSFF